MPYAAIVWTEIKLLVREPLTMLVSLAFPIVLLTLLAASFGNGVDPEFGGIGGTDFYVPVYASATIAVMGFLGVPTHLAAYRERGVLRRFRAAGVSPGALIAAQAVVTVLVMAVGGAVMVTLGLVLYDLSAPASAVGVLLGALVGALAFTALGALLGAVLPTARAAQGVGLLLFFGLFFIAGGGPPPALLPEAINTFIDYTPMGPLVAALSGPWHGEGWDVPALGALGAIGFCAAVLAARALSSQER